MREFHIKVLLLLSLVAFAHGQPKYWIFFRDKCLFTKADTLRALKMCRESLTARCAQRRLRVRSEENLIDWYDLPVCEDYINRIKALGVKIVHKSRWLNAVSARLDSEMVEAVSSLQFVRDIVPVAKAKIIEPMAPLIDTADYGLARRQLRAMNVQYLHRAGVYGDSVMVLITDTGFNLDHIAFRSMDIVASWDFVSGDSNVDIDVGDNPNIVSHGSFCLSLLGGFLANRFSGVAPEAKFLLARTEDLDHEWPVEEDNWVAAVEWAESIGVDIVSTSLGYSDWYSAADMDGDTPRISAAADIAASRGVTIFTAAGNSGPGTMTLVAPGDADSVITVGACMVDKRLAAFSSRGPTADGRIKPDVLAPGVGIYGANGNTNTAFRYASGTSMATPLTAGVGALFLSLRPSLTPMEILEALRMTADKAKSAGCSHGWGVVDAKALVAYPIRDTAFVLLAKGWNIFAPPVDTPIPASVLPVIPPVYGYDSAYMVVDTLYPGHGYFLLSPTDTVFPLVGPRITSLTIMLRRGWNLVGGLSRKTFIVNDFGIENVSQPFIYTLADGKYRKSIALSPSEGGWILIERDKELHLRF